MGPGPYKKMLWALECFCCFNLIGKQYTVTREAPWRVSMGFQLRRRWKLLNFCTFDLRLGKKKSERIHISDRFDVELLFEPVDITSHWFFLCMYVTHVTMYCNMMRSDAIPQCVRLCWTVLHCKALYRTVMRCNAQYRMYMLYIYIYV